MRACWKYAKSNTIFSIAASEIRDNRTKNSKQSWETSEKQRLELVIPYFFWSDICKP